MSANPWMKFYPADWRADPALRVCSLAARGLWMEMLALMHEADERGTLSINGKSMSPERLAALVGATVETVVDLLAELEDAGVFSRKKNGLIFSRRMERDENRARKNRESGKMGGNPTLCNKTEKEESDNQNSGNIPEARSQRVDTLEETSSSKGGEPPSDEIGIDANRRLFSDRVLAFMVDRSAAKDQRSARSLLGKWKRDARDDAGLLLELLTQARNQNIVELAAWMPKAIKARVEPRARPTWRQGMPVAPEPGKPDVFGRTPDHPSYGSSMAI